MNVLTQNEYFQRAAEKEMVEDKVLRLEARPWRTPEVGVVVNVLMDYSSQADPSTKRRTAYGASLLFKNLTSAEFEALASRMVGKYGLGGIAESAAARELLERDDAVSVFYDQTVMDDPVVASQIPPVNAERYGNDGRVGEASFDSIMDYLKKVVCWRGLSDNLNDTHPTWVARLQARSVTKGSELNP